MIGLGRMGANMTQRLLLAGHQLVVYDQNADAVAASGAGGAAAAASVADLVNKLDPPPGRCGSCCRRGR